MSTNYLTTTAAGRPRVNGNLFARNLMGRRVVVTERHWSDGSSQCKPWVGWVVGYTYRRPGKTEHDYDYGSYFVQTGPSVPVVLVRSWPHLKPVDVPFTGFRLAMPNEHPTAEHYLQLDERVRAELSRDAKERKRDARGQFVGDTEPQHGPLGHGRQGGKP